MTKNPYINIKTFSWIYFVNLLFSYIEDVLFHEIYFNS
jgi:hypothetical protein